LPEIANKDIDVLELVGANRIKHTNKAYSTPVGQGYQIRQNIPA